MDNLTRKLTTGAALVGVFALLAAGGYYLVLRELDLTARILLGVGAALVIYALLENSEATVRTLGGRQARYGGNALVMVLAFVAILGLVNFLASSRSQRWDITANRTFTLSEQTGKVLARLAAPVEVKAFFSANDPGREQAEDLMKEFSHRSGFVRYEFIDPDQRPGVAEQYKIRDYGILLFQSGERRQDVTTVTESAFTSALIKLTSNQTKKVYVLTGHDERSIADSGRNGFSLAKDALQNVNYEVENVTLATTGKVPEDAAALIIASPRTQLLPEEKEAIRQYLAGGGKALVLRDPRVGIPLDDLLQEWGVQIGDGVVVDPQESFLNDRITLVIQRYSLTAITEGLRSLTIFPLAAWVQPLAETPGLRVTPFLHSGDKSWVETAKEQVSYEEGQDTRGPVPLAVMVQTQTPTNQAAGGAAEAANPSDPRSKARLVVIGNSNFATNQFINLEGNQDLLVNSVNWLAESEDLIAITPKPPEDRRIVLTGTQSNLVLFSSVVFLPAIVLGIGALVWWRRR